MQADKQFKPVESQHQIQQPSLDRRRRRRAGPERFQIQDHAEVRPMDLRLQLPVAIPGPV